MKQNPYDLSVVAKKLGSAVKTTSEDRPKQASPYDLNRSANERVIKTRKK